MPAWLAPLAIGAGSAAAGALLGEDDKWDMSPEQRQYVEWLWGELQKPQGYSQAEKMAMAQELKNALQEQSQAAIGSSQSSLARRGMLSPGQMSGISTDILSSAGKAYGKGRTDIELASAEAGRRKKEVIMSQLGMSSRGQFIPGDDSIYEDIGGFAGDLSYYLNQPKPQSYDFMNKPSGGQASQTPQLGTDWMGYGGQRGQKQSGWRYDPLTGRWTRR